jgi:DNA (cytosine-5)-methyltransferase 3A
VALLGTYWSISQTKHRETVSSGKGWKLFQQYVRCLREVQPKYFLYENNASISDQIRKAITNEFGFELMELNSALLSAQSRKRLYWCGILENGKYYKARYTTSRR